MERKAQEGPASAPESPADAPCPLVGPQIVIITGMSGAGRTEALHALEDLGYYCIDNLPPSMLVPLSELVGLPVDTGRRLAVVCDVRSREFFDQLRDELKRLSEREISYQVLFLDADDASLRKRYSSLRRRHPLAQDGTTTVSNAIALERARLSSISELANIVIDTTNLRARDLRALLAKEFSGVPLSQGMNVSVFSFGFKYGLPLDADVVIDVPLPAQPLLRPRDARADRPRRAGARLRARQRRDEGLPRRLVQPARRHHARVRLRGRRSTSRSRSAARGAGAAASPSPRRRASTSLPGGIA